VSSPIVFLASGLSFPMPASVAAILVENAQSFELAAIGEIDGKRGQVNVGVAAAPTLSNG
jgi:hypothetical protein